MVVSRQFYILSNAVFIIMVQLSGTVRQISSILKLKEAALFYGYIVIHYEKSL